MSVEDWKSLCDVGAVLALFLAFAFGIGVLITGNRVNEKQAAQLRQFDKGLTEARTALSEAKVELQQELQKTAVAQKEADVARLALDRQIASQQRRAAILMDPHNRASFGTPLKKFRGQKFDVVACGMKESEIGYFSLAVWSTLEGDFVDWTVGKIENNSPSCQPGLAILTDPDAPTRTVEAAKELLNSFVRIKLERAESRIGMIPPPPPDADKPGVWYLAPSSVDSIIVMIGTHP